MVLEKDPPRKRAVGVSGCAVGPQENGGGYCLRLIASSCSFCCGVRLSLTK